MPKVSILLPAHNAQGTLAETLHSLSIQSFRDFDVVLVNDASTDETGRIAERFKQSLNIRQLDLAENSGVAGALARGLATIDSPLVARLDADDIAHPLRLERQVALMDAEQGVDVCGTQIGFFSGEFVVGAQLRVLSHPTASSVIKTGLIQYCSLVHGSAIFRREFFDDVGGYDRRFDFAEDYDLWCRGSLLGKQYVNIPEMLTFVRKHGGQVSQAKAGLQFERDIKIKRYYISALLGGDSAGVLPEFFSLQTMYPNQADALALVEQAVPQLIRLGTRIFDEPSYSGIVAACIRRHLGKQL